MHRGFKANKIFCLEQENYETSPRHFFMCYRSGEQGHWWGGDMVSDTDGLKDLGMTALKD